MKTTKKKDNLTKNNTNIAVMFRNNVSQNSNKSSQANENADTLDDCGQKVAPGKLSVQLYSSSDKLPGNPVMPDLASKLSVSKQHLVKGLIDQTTNKDPGKQNPDHEPVQIDSLKREQII